MTDSHLERQISTLTKTHPSSGRHKIHTVSDHGTVTLLNYLLLLSPASVTYKSSNGGLTPLHYASKRGSHPELCHRLLESSLTPVEAKDKSGWTPLHYAAYNHQPETVKKLLGKGNADVNARTSEMGETPLILACRSGVGGSEKVKKTVEALLAGKGVKTRVRNDEGRRAREIAEGRGRQVVVELIDRFDSA